MTEHERIAEFNEFVRRCLTEIDAWPDWKRGLLRGPLRHPRQPTTPVTAIDKVGAAAAPTYAVGERVRKDGGDYTFEGVVVAAFAKRSGATRYVVEDDRGLLFIFAGSQLRRDPAHVEEEPS